MSELAQLQVTVPAEVAEAACNLLMEEGGGVEHRDRDTSPDLTPGVVEIRMWLPDAEVKRRVQALEVLLSSLKEMGIKVDPWSWRSDPADPMTWQDAYKRHFTTFRVGMHFVIKPSWETYEDQPGELLIEMDPGMAFGTGLHPTTKLMLHAMERLARLNPAPRSVVDLGCGTGVLSIAAARLWPACRILAIDNDELAVQVCRENVARNQLSGRIAIESGSVSKVDGQHSLVLANLNLETLTELHSQISHLPEEYGRVVVSGLLSEQSRSIVRLYTCGLSFEPEYSEEIEGWQAHIFRIRR